MYFGEEISFYPAGPKGYPALATLNLNGEFCEVSQASCISHFLHGTPLVSKLDGLMKGRRYTTAVTLTLYPDAL